MNRDWAYVESSGDHALSPRHHSGLIKTERVREKGGVRLVKPDRIEKKTRIQLQKELVLYFTNYK
jgi:hypothetical protein